MTKKCSAMITGVLFFLIASPLEPIYAAPIAPGDYIYVTDQMLLSAAKDPNNWFFYGRDYASTRFSPLTQINRNTIKHLVPKWAFSLTPMASPVAGQDTQLIVNNGIGYVTAAWSHLYAIDLRTGRMLWRYDKTLPDDLAARLCCDAVNRGVALYGNKVYWGTLDAHLMAFDALTGKVIWDTVVEDHAASYTLTVAPLPVRGKVVIGISGGEYGIRGFIQAFDAETGKSVWKTYTVPAPGEPGSETWPPGDAYKNGGGAAWVTGSYDPELNLLYWGVGNPSPDFDPDARPGDNLYTNSTLALDPDTGKIKFHFQYTPHDAWDYDGVNEVILVDLDGRKVWLHADRNGHFYAIDRTDGKFIYAKPYAQVNWGTIDPAMGRPTVNPGRATARGKNSLPHTCPGASGGKEWRPMAYSPRTNYAYVPVIENCAEFFTASQSYRKGQPFWGGGMNLSRGKGWGHLSAIDVKTGETVWQINNRSPIVSGVLATAGDLVFFGNPEGEFMAADAKTGEVLWKFQTGSGIVGVPSTFSVDGKQYVAVPSGWGGWLGGYAGDGTPWTGSYNGSGMLFIFGLHEELGKD